MLERLHKFYRWLVWKFYSLEYKWYYRKEINEERKRREWEFMLHGYTSCLYYVSEDSDNGYCSWKARNKFLCFFRYRNYFCDKKKCKHYAYDPMKGRT